MHYKQIGFILKMQSWFNFWKAINVIHHIESKEEKNTWLFKPLQKNIWQNLTPTHNKNSQQTRNSRKSPQSYKGQPTVTNFQTEIRNKARLSTVTIIIQHHSESPSQFNKLRKRTKRHTHYQGRNKNYSFCRQHSYVHIKYQGIHTKKTTPKTSKQNN